MRRERRGDGQTPTGDPAAAPRAAGTPTPSSPTAPIITYFLFEARNTQQREAQSSLAIHTCQTAPHATRLLYCYHQRESLPPHTVLALSDVASRDIQSHLTYYAAYYALRSSRQMREKRDAVELSKSQRERETEEKERRAVRSTKQSLKSFKNKVVKNERPRSGHCASLERNRLEYSPTPRQTTR